MKYMLPVLILGASLVGSKISLPEIVSGGALAKKEKCDGKVAELTCASSVANETCKPSSKIEQSTVPNDQRYTPGDGDNKCSDKNPNTSCDGAARKPSGDCDPPVVAVVDVAVSL